jgi:hypothetical protein
MNIEIYLYEKNVGILPTWRVVTDQSRPKDLGECQIHAKCLPNIHVP